MLKSKEMNRKQQSERESMSGVSNKYRMRFRKRGTFEYGNIGANKRCGRMREVAVGP